GQFLSRNFEESRLRTKKMIEEQLADVSLAKSKGTISFPPAAMSQVSPVSSQGGERSQSEMRRKSSWGFVVVAALLVAGVFLAVYSSRTAQSDPVASAAPLAHALPHASGRSIDLDAPTAHAARGPISVRIAAAPPEASIVVDGAAVAGNPYVATVPADG